MRPRFSSCAKQPPPVATTAAGSDSVAARKAVSRSRNAASPDSSKSARMVFPLVRSISSSRSTKGIQTRSATRRPIVVLPAAMKPTT